MFRRCDVPKWSRESEPDRSLSGQAEISGIIGAEVGVAEVAEHKRQVVEDPILGLSVITVFKVLQLLRIVTAVHTRSDLA